MSRHLSTKLAVIMVGICFSIISASGGERFMDNGDGTVTDNELGIMWAKTDNHGNIDWIQAEKWVKYTFPYTLPNNYDNWRLPTIDELKTLYDHNVLYDGYEADCGQKVKIVYHSYLTQAYI